ncbi:hypothetical protein AAG570_007298 [Ranatra chinensis]|uniref:Uncharacterized protein n=1 Tax=Ranatra chinensis TaxID=642074 RepID=A0ABD0XVG2_9HEMI
MASKRRNMFYENKKQETTDIGLVFSVEIMRSGGVDLFPDHDSYLYVEGSAMKDFVLEYHLYHCMALLSPAFNFTWSRSCPNRSFSCSKSGWTLCVVSRTVITHMFYQNKKQETTEIAHTKRVSRWNLLAGPKKLVLQMREYTCRKRIPQYSTLLVRRDASLLVDCNEVSPSFSEQAIGTSDLDSLWTEDEPEEEVVTCIDKPETGEEFYPDLHSLAEALATRRAKETLEKPETRLVETVFFLLKATKVMSYS